MCNVSIDIVVSQLIQIHGVFQYVACVMNPMCQIMHVFS